MAAPTERETDGGKVLRRVNDDQPMVAEFDERFELGAADPEVRDLGGAARVAVPEAVCEIDAVVR
jgi:hypothetical protein